MSKPTTDPGTGRTWQRLTDVALFTAGAPNEASLSVWPSFGGVTAYNHGSNYSNPAATQLVYEQWTSMTIQMYLDHAQSELIGIAWPRGAAGPNDGAWSHGSMPASRMSASVNPAGMPVAIGLEYWTGPLMAVGGVGPPPTSAGADMRLIRGDVWANLLANSELPVFGGTPTTAPPPLQVPESVAADLRVPGIRLDWTRQEERGDVSLFDLGQVVGLTEARLHLADRSFLQFGVQLQVEALPAGGYGTHWARTFVKVPGQDIDGDPLWFVVDTTAVDDPAHPIY